VKISVLTPSYNARKFLPDCIASVRHALAGRDFEHVIADGASNDGTVDFLREQDGVFWHSEPDRGMYDALNKAGARANGEIFIHLNSDEQLNRIGVLAALELMEKKRLDGVLGPTVMVDGERNFLQIFKQIVVPTVMDSYWHMPVQTCSFIYRRFLWDRRHYDARYRLIADHLWFRRQMEMGVNLGVVRQPIGIFTWHGDNLSSVEGKTSDENAMGEVRVSKERLDRAKKFYRLRKLLSGGYLRRPVEYEIFREGQRATVRLSRPRLKIRANPRDFAG